MGGMGEGCGVELALSLCRGKAASVCTLKGLLWRLAAPCGALQDAVRKTMQGVGVRVDHVDGGWMEGGLVGVGGGGGEGSDDGVGKEVSPLDGILALVEPGESDQPHRHLRSD